MREDKSPSQSPAPSAFELVGRSSEVLAAEACYAEHLADRLVGPVPVSGGSDESTPAPSALFAALGESAIRSAANVQRIHNALSRIEAALP